MIYFPNISAPSYPFDEELEDNSLRSAFEDGSMQSRRKFTRSRTKYTVKWENLPGDEYRILKDFIINKVHYSSEAFAWQYPKFNVRNSIFDTGLNDVGDKLIMVRITNVEKPTCNAFDYWTVTLELTEV